MLDLKTYIRVMHLLGFIRSMTKKQAKDTTTKEEEQLSDLWRCLT